MDSPPLSRQSSFVLLFPKDSTVSVFPPFDADSYPNPNLPSDDESCLNLMDLPLLCNGSFDSMDLLPVHDTVAAFPHLQGDSHSCPNSHFPPAIFLDSNQVYADSIVPETQFTQISDSFVPETQFTQISDSFVSETQFTQISDSYVTYEPPEFTPIEEKAPSIESKVSNYLSTLGMLAIFLPRWIKKDALDSPYYPAIPEVREFLHSTRYQRSSSFIVKASEETSGAIDTSELITDLKEKWDAVENKSTVVIYGGGAVVAIWLSSILVGAINSVPLLPKILELVGLGYTGWFVYRYLLFKSSRKELATDIESLKKKIAGTTE